MIDISYASLKVEHSALTERPIQPFTKELLDLHRQVFTDPYSFVVPYENGHKLTRTAQHRTMAGVILDATIKLPIENTLDDRASFHLGIKEDSDEMTIDLPVSELSDLAMHDDPFAGMIADYFRQHVRLSVFS